MLEAKETWLAGPRASFQTGSIKDLSAKAAWPPVPLQPCPEATVDPGASSGAGKEAVWTLGNISSSTSSRSFRDHCRTTGNLPQPRRPRADSRGPVHLPAMGLGPRTQSTDLASCPKSRGQASHSPAAAPGPCLLSWERARSLRPCPVRSLLASFLVGSYERRSRAQASGPLRGKQPLN